ncbi:LasR-specific antiactivator QslA [Pseudomonas benzenivorans]|uniref:LasR-specific antiactivator QslA n=1 Tax=Pseudomonas benzenivorans TaxID=556533 RepID=A0ABZ0PST3_9PSED|nr:LasR-specific antiactivator QslA [Pseudomonas benzenivorans]WPC04212.1 LasR-specific antiactivator QslA [Pseudomonas benzenivorans]
MNRPCTSHLPPHDGHRGAIIKWPVNCHEAFDRGVASAQAWLSNDDSGWLWANLIIERDALPPGAQRRAFEIGFLSRVHQRLCSPFGGNHQARKTCLQL